MILAWSTQTSMIIFNPNPGEKIAKAALKKNICAGKKQFFIKI